MLAGAGLALASLNEDTSLSAEQRGNFAGAGGAAGGLLLGGALGILTAITLDASVLSYHRVPKPASSPRQAAASSGYSLVPRLSLTKTETTFGVGGLF